MNIQPLPFPFDPSCVLREANLDRARKIYGFARQQAQHIAQTSPQDGPQSLNQWPETHDVCMIAVQPIQPSQKLQSARELQSKVRELRNGRLGQFITGFDVQIPGGIIFSSLSIARNRRSLQILFDNGLVCHMGEVQAKSNGSLPRLHLPRLVQQIANTILIAHHLYSTTKPKGDMSLLISLEDLGKHSVEPLFSGGFTHDYDLALVENWSWEYLIPD